MAENRRGKLIRQPAEAARKWVLKLIDKKSGQLSPIPTPFADINLSAQVAGRNEQEIEVELELHGIMPKRIRPVGEEYIEPEVKPETNPPVSSVSQAPRVQTQRPQQRPRQQQPAQPREREFHNPYNFIPALPRNGVIGELGDHEPPGHHLFHADRYTGAIRVKMTVNTPLLLPDAALVIDSTNGHKTFPVRIGDDGRPYLPPTSVKGMLRAAYEAVTNSRMAVFPGNDATSMRSASGHGARLAERMPARDGLRLVPARIVGDRVELLPGTSAMTENGSPDGPMYAAWLRRYNLHLGQVALDAVRYPDGSLPEHGDAVTCWIKRTEHHHPGFEYWRVRKIYRLGDAVPDPNEGSIKVDGHVCITNRNIDRKHDERVFFSTRPNPVYCPLTNELREYWRYLISDYQAIHESERESGMSGPPALEHSFWSRHVISGRGEEELADGKLCYAAFNSGSVTALYPVMISRRLFEASPIELLSESLRPASEISQLSPADRVFGWVRQGGKGAYRGNVRIGPIKCETSDAIEKFCDTGVPLAILGQPKPQQARFYVGALASGKAQADGTAKGDVGYSPGKGLRGRKVYPHHRVLPTGHWNDPTQDRTQEAANGHFQEYRRPDGKDCRDKQNRSILGWVKPGTEFTFDIHVTNLSGIEMGTLLWLLSLPDAHYHRLGGGKPLGFGSVKLEISGSDLRSGEQWQQVYSTLDEPGSPVDNCDILKKEYEEAVRKSYKAASFDKVSFIAAFLRMAAGFEDTLPIHYPRARQQGPGAVPPHPEGRAFEWFVANEKTGQNGGPRVSLPDLATDNGLPMLDAP